MNRSLLAKHITIPCRLVVYDEVDSTNDVLKRKTEQEDGHEKKYPSVIVAVADRQTAGRGRFGRSWASPAGGVYLSLALTLETSSEQLSSLSLVTACALREALSAYTNSGRTISASCVKSASVGIKWPNDIIASYKGHEGKLAGILIETIGGKPICNETTGNETTGNETIGGKPISNETTGNETTGGKPTGNETTGNKPVQNAQRVIIGVGVNVARPAQTVASDEHAMYLSDLIADTTAQRISETSEISREMVAACVINAICAHITAWRDHSYSFAFFKDEYEQHLTLLAQEVVVRHMGANVIHVIAEGVVQGVNGYGQLVVQNSQNGGELIAVSVGDVTLRSAGL